MDPEIKIGWMADLRSGEYLQGIGLLRKSNCQDKFCCLGVLQDRVAPEQWIEPILDVKFWSVPHATDDDWDDDIFPNEGELSAAMLNRVGITAEQQEELMTLNDGRKWNATIARLGENTQSKENPEYCEGHEPQDFKAIANWIEENL